MTTLRLYSPALVMLGWAGAIGLDLNGAAIGAVGLGLLAWSVVAHLAEAKERVRAWHLR